MAIRCASLRPPGDAMPGSTRVQVLRHGQVRCAVTIRCAADRLTGRLAGSGGLAVLALIAANAIWGRSAAASKEAMGALGPFAVGTGRAGVALAVLSILIVLRHERPATGRQPALLGLCGIALFRAFQNLGLLVADATTTIISGARPVVIAVLAVPLLGECRSSASRGAACLTFRAVPGLTMRSG